MKEINTASGFVIIVDDADYDDVNRWRWGVYSNKRGYKKVRRRTSVDGLKGSETLARRIMGAKKGDIVDHINGNTLDNRRSNLRFVTHSQNTMNRPPGKLGNTGARSKYRGVISRHKTAAAQSSSKKVWYSAYKSRYLGYCETEEEAAYLYDLAALRDQGPSAQLNFPKAELQHFGCA